MTVSKSITANNAERKYYGIWFSNGICLSTSQMDGWCSDLTGCYIVHESKEAAQQQAASFERTHPLPVSYTAREMEPSLARQILYQRSLIEQEQSCQDLTPC